MATLKIWVCVFLEIHLKLLFHQYFSWYILHAGAMCTPKVSILCKTFLLISQDTLGREGGPAIMNVEDDLENPFEMQWIIATTLESGQNSLTLTSHYRSNNSDPTNTQWCRFLSQEVREISCFFVAPPTRVRPRLPSDISCAKFEFLLINLHHWVVPVLIFFWRSSKPGFSKNMQKYEKSPFAQSLIVKDTSLGAAPPRLLWCATPIDHWCSSYFLTRAIKCVLSKFLKRGFH